MYGIFFENVDTGERILFENTVVDDLEWANVVFHNINPPLGFRKFLHQLQTPESEHNERGVPPDYHQQPNLRICS